MAARKRPIKCDLAGVPSISPEVYKYPIFLDGAVSLSDPGADRWRLLSADELGQVPAVRWLIPGWLAANELTVIYGRGGSFKSFIAQTWCYQLALQGKVCVYIAAEGMSGVRVRAAAWMVIHQVRSLPSLFFVGENVAIHQEAEVSRWCESITAQLEDRGYGSPDLVIVDTVARNFVGGDENSAKDLGQFVEGCEAIRQKMGTAVLPLHHTRKADGAERGSEALRNASFAMLRTGNVTPLKSKVRVGLSCNRLKDAEPPEPVTVEFVRVPLPPLSETASVTGLATATDIPTGTAVAEQDGDILRGHILDILGEQSGPIGIDPLLEEARSRGLSIAQGKGRRLIRAWADDPAMRITRDARGLRLEEES